MLKRFFDFVYQFSMNLCKVLFIIMIVITAYVVFGRYVLHSHPVWGEEVVLMAMTYMALISAGLAIRREAHMKMTVLDLVLSEKTVNRLKLIATVCIMAFSLLMIIIGTKFTLMMRLSRMTGLQIPTSWQYLAVPVAGVVLFIMTLEKVLEAAGIVEKTVDIDADDRPTRPETVEVS